MRLSISFIFIFLAFTFTGCAHQLKLMKCPFPAPPDVYRCTSQVDGDYLMCGPADDDYTCTEPF